MVVGSAALRRSALKKGSCITLSLGAVLLLWIGSCMPVPSIKNHYNYFPEVFSATYHGDILQIDTDAGTFQADLTEYLSAEPPYTVPDGKERVEARLFKRGDNVPKLQFANNVTYTRDPPRALNWVFDTSALDPQTLEKREWYDHANARRMDERGEVQYEIKEIPTNPESAELVLLNHSHPYQRNFATTYCFYAPDREPQLHVMVLPREELTTPTLGIKFLFNPLEGVH